MKFGDLQSMIHRGELPPLFATLPEDQHGYAMRMAGERLAARAHRMRIAQWLVYAENPLHWKTRKEIDPSLDPLLRWYASDVASETMRVHGNGDSRSLRAIEVARAYVQGRASKEDLRRAQRDATVYAYADADTAAYAAAYNDAHAAAATAHADASEAAADAAADDAIWATTYRKHRTLLTNWFRAYLMRWIEEGPWWEVSS